MKYNSNRKPCFPVAKFAEGEEDRMREPVGSNVPSKEAESSSGRARRCRVGRGVGGRIRGKDQQWQ